MQFKHPELLWSLFLLLIPIFIHLFQLRKFKKTPFTNVALLQKVISNSRRSNTLKKWLLLLTRLLLLASLVIAFAQPFYAEKLALTERQTVIYLDDSFSMQAKTGNTSLLQNAVQELIKSVPKTAEFHLFTNERVFRNVTIGTIQDELLALTHSSKQLTLDQIELKANSFFNEDGETIKELIIISDFQKKLGEVKLDSLSILQKHLIRTVADEFENIALDSVYIANEGPENIELTLLLSGNSKNGSIPVSLYDDEQLIAKTAVELVENNKGKVNFTLPGGTIINGRIEISDSGLTYDNILYFNINEKKRIKVLSIGDDEGSKFLDRIFTEDEFEHESNLLSNLTYSDIEEQNLIVLNELARIPIPLQTSLKSFKANGGSLVLIPPVTIDFESYNQLLNGISNVSFIENINTERKITDIDFTHPLYRNVFEKKVTNFQYPTVKSFNRINSTEPTMLSLQGGEPFLIGSNQMYLFTASISKENSNFKNSPLIVPTLYNIGVKSLEIPKLYATLGSPVTIDVPIQLTKDNILKVVKEDYEFIPRQQSFARKVSLQFSEEPKEDGIYTISDNTETYQNISFNHSRQESNLSYLDFENINAASKNTSIKNLFETLQKDTLATELWKWFVILVLLFLLAEILIQKFIK